MANFLNIFRDKTGEVITDFICPYKLDMKRGAYVNYATTILYQKILKRCYAKSIGLKQEQARSLWDSVEMSEAQYGVITLVADAMTSKNELILINDNDIIREATPKERIEIKKDYSDNGKSTKGVYMNFNKYTLTDLIKLYFDYIYDIMYSGKVNLGLARALQFKVSDLRKNVGANASDDVMVQARALENGLKNGKGVLIDAGDSVVTTDLQTTPIVDALKMVYGMLASAIGVSTSFICGELTSGMSVTGEADVNANEDGIKDFFISVFKPIVDKLFKVNLKFKTDNWRKLTQYAQIIPYVESSSLFTDEQRQMFANYLIEVEE